MSNREVICGLLQEGVAPDHIVSIDVRSFKGHVYNLQTKTGMYQADTVITSNCWCAIDPVFASLEESRDPDWRPPILGNDYVSAVGKLVAKLTGREYLEAL